MNEQEYLTLNDAAAYLGVSRFKVWQLVKAGRLQAYQNDADRRHRWFKRADLDDVKRLRPVEGEEGKAAA